MNPAGDPGSPQGLPQRVALGLPDHILMKDVHCLWPARRKCQQQSGETGIITVSDLLPASVVSLQRSGLDAEDGGLDRVETGIDAAACADMTLAPAVLSNFPQRRRE